ncbi:MAG: acylneuraminate cytidylyltransferase family protein [Gilvibacter sp.]
MRILGLIPARGGSKGIPGKNAKLLNGTPLLGYTAKAALAATHLDSVVFSSEDYELITIAKEFGLDAPFIRPADLATDGASSLSVVQHAIDYFKGLGAHFDAVCLLQVTTPFRTSEDIDAAIQKFKTQGTDALVSVQKVPHVYNPHWVFTETQNGRIALATGTNEIIGRRQDLPPAYIRDGAIYLCKTEVIMQQNSLYGKSLAYIESDPDTYVNIDGPEDWDRAEQIAKNL